MWIEPSLFIVSSPTGEITAQLLHCDAVLSQHERDYAIHAVKHRFTHINVMVEKELVAERTYTCLDCHLIITSELKRFFFMAVLQPIVSTSTIDIRKLYKDNHHRTGSETRGRHT